MYNVCFDWKLLTSKKLSLEQSFDELFGFRKY